MKWLIVAHPDDEVLWFNPEDFDMIAIIFGGRHDKPHFEENRKRAIASHPLKDKIIHLGLTESGYWKEKSRKDIHQENTYTVQNFLLMLKQNYPVTEIYTHNKMGEYGHDDHILVHHAVVDIFQADNPLLNIWLPTNCVEGPVKSVKNNPCLYQEIMTHYLNHKVWTWKLDYHPPQYFSYIRC